MLKAKEKMEGVEEGRKREKAVEKFVRIWEEVYERLPEDEEG